jgi:hypothetical protein
MDGQLEEIAAAALSMPLHGAMAGLVPAIAVFLREDADVSRQAEAYGS